MLLCALMGESTILICHLRRDCACRGTDAGFVHLSCLADYAASKSKQRLRVKDMNEFTDHGSVAKVPYSCHQDYQNELAIDITTQFVSFVRR